MRGFIACLALAAWLALSAARAQDTLPTADELSARIVAVTSDQSIPEQVRVEAIAAYRAAETDLGATTESLARAASWESEALDAPARLEQITLELERAPQNVDVGIGPDDRDALALASLASLEASLAQASAELAAAQTELDALQTEVASRSERQRELPTLIAQAQQLLARLEEEAARPPAPDTNTALTEARRVQNALRAARQRALARELEAELTNLAARKDLLPARRDQASRRVDFAQRTVKAWQGLVDTKRRLVLEEAEAEASRLRMESAGKAPLLQSHSAEVERLTSELSGPEGLSARLTALAPEMQRRQVEHRDLVDRDRRVRRKALAGSAGDMGLALRRQLLDLPDRAPIERRIETHRRALSNAQERLLALDDDEQRSSDVEQRVTALLEDLPPGDTQTRADQEQIARQLFSQERELVRRLLSDYETYANQLGALIELEQSTLGLATSLRSYIAERVLWVRSVPEPFAIDTGASLDGLAWLTDADAWRRGIEASVRAAYPWISARAATPVFWGGLGVLAIGAMVAKVRLVRAAIRPLPRHGRVSMESLLGTLRALALTILAATPEAAALAIVAFWLRRPQEQPEVVIATSTALGRASFIVLALSLLYEFSRARGVGVTHFRWPAPAVAHIRRGLRWLAPPAVLAVFIVRVFDDQPAGDTLGRAALCVGLVLTAFFYWRVFSPRAPLMREYARRRRGSIIERTRWVWSVLLAGAPCALLVATIFGYSYAAVEIQRRIADTFLIAFAVIVANALVLRWLQLARRRLALDAARARAALTDAPRPDDPQDEPDLDLITINVQTRKLLQAASAIVVLVLLFGVWSDVLPALRVLSRVQVFPSVRYVEIEAPGIDSGEQAAPTTTETAATPPEPPVPPIAPQPGAALPTTSPTPAAVADGPGQAGTARAVTLADLGLAILVLALTIVASRNIPGLLEIVLLQRLPMNSGARYAAATIARYLIVIAGVVAISNALGVPWRSAQWLVAALTFGLAFGLQEIFANFVSGLIILFEQPVRVGDTVTIGQVHGTVSRIRMRATTITDWDNRELIVPNKLLITDQIVNWTLASPDTRLVIPVGVAYGTDPDRVRELLLRAASRTPNLVASRPQRALFVGLGENALLFELRVYADSIDNAITARDRLLSEITALFAGAGVEIAFPQRELRIRAIDPALLSPRAHDRGTTADGAS